MRDCKHCGGSTKTKETRYLPALDINRVRLICKCCGARYSIYTDMSGRFLADVPLKNGRPAGIHTEWDRSEPIEWEFQPMPDYGSHAFDGLVANWLRSAPILGSTLIGA